MGHSGSRLCHYAKQAGIGHEGTNSGLAMCSHVLTRTAAREQKLRHQIVRAEIRIASVRPGSPPPPRLTEDGARYVESCWHGRSEEHTSELQSLMRISYAVFCLKQKT